ncbi:MAG: glycosyltransferase family 2 protein [Bacteroidetes bacterium]|nr:glycosyltransferase family 2 protein [Bacteroidota bacterium]
MKLSIIIPVYNEEGGIEATIDELERYMKDYSGCSRWELILVNDGSSDSTLKVINSIKQTKPWLKIVDLVNNFGRGKALRRGLEESTGDIIVSLDADLSYAPNHIERMVEKLVNNNADLVLASAYGSGGTVKSVPFIRLWISRLGNMILSFMYGENITVLTCIARAYRKTFIERLDLHSNNKDIHLEILYKAKMLGAKILEVPGDLKWRKNKVVALEKQKKRRSTLKFRRTSRSHFFFALLNRPGMIYFVPGSILFVITLLISFLSLKAIVPDIINGMSVYIALRKSILSATPSWLTLAVSFILSIQFFSLGFLTNQNKKNYEETYKTINSIFKEIKKIK